MTREQIGELENHMQALYRAESSIEKAKTSVLEMYERRHHRKTRMQVKAERRPGNLIQKTLSTVVIPPGFVALPAIV